MKQLSELRGIALMCMAIDACNRAVDYKASTELFRLGEDLTRVINHQIGDKLTDLEKQSADRKEEVVIPFREQLESDPALQNTIDKKYDHALEKDTVYIELNRKIAELWQTEVEYDMPVIEVQNKDFYESFPVEKKQVPFRGLSWEVDGLAAFKHLDRQEIIKIV